MDCHFRDLPDFQSSEARLMTKQWDKKFSTKFDDLGVIIMRNFFSIQQGEKR